MVRIYDKQMSPQLTLAGPNTPGAPSRQAPGQALSPLHRLSAFDRPAMAGGFLLCLLIGYVLGFGRIFWEDEMLGWMLLHDPSWKHMIFAWNQGADGGGFIFYVTCRAWFAVFGASETAFRMYSAVCFGLAFCVTWITARSFYRFAFVAPALFGAWFLSPPLVTHLAEGRFYGLLMLTVSLVVWFTAVAARTPGRAGQMPLPTLCALAFVLNGLLVTSHVLGIVYSATLLVALMLIDRNTAWQPALYAATAGSWLLLLPERTAILATAQVGKPYFWTTPPDLSRFFGAYCEFSAGIAALLAILILLLLGTTILPRPRRQSTGRALWQDSAAGRRPILLVVLTLFLLPIALTLQARFGTSLFINRYLMPLTIAEALLLCQLFAMVDWRRLLPAARPAQATGALAWGGVLYAALLLTYVFAHLTHFPIEPGDFTPELTARLPHGIPVLCEDAWIFTQLIGKQHASGVDYTYLLDLPQTLSPSAPRLELTQYHLMENWKKAGYFAGSIQQRAPFLAEHPRFLVLHTADVPVPGGPIIGNPLLQRFEHTAGYQVMPYDTPPKGGIQIWQVCRGACPIDSH